MTIGRSGLYWCLRFLVEGRMRRTCPSPVITDCDCRTFKRHEMSRPRRMPSKRGREKETQQVPVSHRKKSTEQPAPSGESGSESSDSDDPRHIVIDYDVNELSSDDVARLDFVSDQFLPSIDVNRDPFARGVVKYAIAASTIDVEGSGTSSNDPPDLYGVVAFVDVARAIAERDGSFTEFLDMLKRPAAKVVHQGVAAAELLQLRSTANGFPRFALCFSGRFPNLPPLVVGQVYQHTLGELIAAASSTGVVVCAKGQCRTERDFAFWNWEDEVMFAYRDTRAATIQFLFPPEFDGQPEPEVPRCLVFAVPSGNLRSVADAVATKGSSLGQESDATVEALNTGTSSEDSDESSSTTTSNGGSTDE